jgi:hypothetical protein
MTKQTGRRNQTDRQTPLTHTYTHTYIHTYRHTHTDTKQERIYHTPPHTTIPLHIHTYIHSITNQSFNQSLITCSIDGTTTTKIMSADVCHWSAFSPFRCANSATKQYIQNIKPTSTLPHQCQLCFAHINIVDQGVCDVCGHDGVNTDHIIQQQQQQHELWSSHAHQPTPTILTSTPVTPSIVIHSSGTTSTPPPPSLTVRAPPFSIRAIQRLRNRRLSALRKQEEQKQLQTLVLQQQQSVAEHLFLDNYIADNKQANNFLRQLDEQTASPVQQVMAFVGRVGRVINNVIKHVTSTVVRAASKLMGVVKSIASTIKRECTTGVDTGHVSTSVRVAIGHGRYRWYNVRRRRYYYRQR